MKRRNFTKIQKVKQHKKGRFSNPYFKHKKIKKARRFRLLLILIFILVIATPIIIIASPLFKIQNVNISGLTTINEEEVLNVVENQIQERRFGLFNQSKSIFFNHAKLNKTLQEKYDFLSLEIEVKNRSIYIKIEERISHLIWISSAEMYVLSLDGIVLRRLHDFEQQQINERLGLPSINVESDFFATIAPTMPIVFDDSNSEVTIDNPAMPVVNVQVIIDFDKEIRKLLIRPKTYGIENPNSSWLQIDTNMSFNIKIDGNDSAENQISMLKYVIQERENELNQAQHIDLRFGKYVFVK